MAVCSSLDHIFDKPLPENPTLLESLSPWKQMKSVKQNLEDSSYTEIFGELHFKEDTNNHKSSPSSSLSPKTLQQIANEMAMEVNSDRQDKNESFYPIRKQYRQYSDGFSSMNSESLSLCTEGLGFESSDDVEEWKIENSYSDFQSQNQEKISISNQFWKESKRSRTSRGSFPPPISCIGRTGKPWVHFKSYREDGRFILQEIRIPTYESLHASREDGRLKLQFIQSDDDEILEGDEDEDCSATDENDFGEFNCEEIGQIHGVKDEKLSNNDVGG